MDVFQWHFEFRQYYKNFKCEMPCNKVYNNRYNAQDKSVYLIKILSMYTLLYWKNVIKNLLVNQMNNLNE